MSIYKDLLFLHGYVTRPGDLASPASAARGAASSTPATAPRDARANAIDHADVPADEDCPAPARTAWRSGAAPAARPTGGWFPLAAAGDGVSTLGLPEERDWFGHAFGNRVASLRAFGGRVAECVTPQAQACGCG
ncbi:MAG: hypothetical protein ACM32J_04165 [Rhizobacter sp.]